MLAWLPIVDAASVGSSSTMLVSASTVQPLAVLSSHPYLTSILSILLIAALVSYLLSPKAAAGEPPLVPSFIPFLGSALSFASNPTAFLSSCRRRYGEIFTVNLGGRRIHFLCDPLSYPALFKHRGLSFFTVAARIAHDVLDQSQRSLQHEPSCHDIHALYARHLSGQGLEQLTRNSHREIARWLSADKAKHSTQAAAADGWIQRGLSSLITELVFDASVEAFFGHGLDLSTLQPLFHTVSIRDKEAAITALAVSGLLSLSQPVCLCFAYVSCMYCGCLQFDKAFPLLVGGAPGFVVSKAKAARAALIRTFATLQEREGEAALMTARRECCQAYSDIIDLHDVGTMQNAMLWASTANTLPAAFWSVAYLLHDAEALAAVQAEIDSVLPRRPLQADDGDEAELCTRDQCAQLRVLESAISEALRLSTGSMVMREATAPTTLTLASGQTVSIRTGDGVSVYPALTHFDSRIFPHPERYQYDRFLSSPVPTLDGVKVASAFMPFGAGASMCPGRHWAMNEIKLLVALLLHHCEWRLMDGDTAVPPVDYSRVGIGVYQPKRDMQVRYRYK